MMYGLRFEEQPEIVASDPNRADIACFVGYVARRTAGGSPQPLPPTVAGWLVERGWLAPGSLQSDLRQVPTPIDTWEVFDRLFAWEARPLAAEGVAVPRTALSRSIPTYLGAAVRTFFAQGGRKCYVVAVADPWPYLEEPITEGERETRMRARLAPLLPGYTGGMIEGSPVDGRGAGVPPGPPGPLGWHGIAHLLGLGDVALVCLPDLPDILRTQTVRIRTEVEPPPPPEVFVECSANEPAPPPDNAPRRIQAPRCDARGYTEWALALQAAGAFLGAYARTAQLIVALPAPEEGEAHESDPLLTLMDGEGLPLARTPGATPPGCGSAFVQAVFPWVRTGASTGLPEGLECPDGVLAGMLARSALVRGSFVTIGGQRPLDVYDLVPALRRRQIEELRERISLLAPGENKFRSANGLRLISDVTLSASIPHRQAAGGRLTASLLRAARLLGEGLSFEVASESLWGQVRDSLTLLLEQFRAAGALRGATAEEAYQVRCDRSTMTQNDIDNGRVIAEVRFDPAATIDAITVVLTLHEGGQATLQDSR